MDDIRKQDLRLFVREAFSFGRVAVYAFALWLGWTAGSNQSFPMLAISVVLVLAAVVSAYNESVRRRFRHPRFRAMWAGCEDRLVRFEEAMKRLRRDQIADLNELPRTIRGVGVSIYAALRRADMIADEVVASEGQLVHQPPHWIQNPHDPQSKELFQLADRNLAEYRSQYQALMAGVERTEGQAAVFMTTVDSLRMKVLGYRLVGKSPSMDSQEFLEAIAEARLQLESIDTALEELDLGHYPKQISVVQRTSPPPIPPGVRVRSEEDEPPTVEQR